ncbi:MAG TPA: peptidase S10 [Terriglobales bacterium]|nr:peptidase S10 [Terriglobales bacterium]
MRFLQLTILAAFLAALSLPAPAFAQRPDEDRERQAAEQKDQPKPEAETVIRKGKLPDGKDEQAKDEKKDEKKEPEPVVTRHEIRVGGKTLRYTATTGRLPIKNADGETEAHMFFVAYTLDGGGPKRPLMFSFNGGPGSSSVWLHLGAVGPKRVKMLPEGFMPSPPFQLVDNEFTWLDQVDLVFIDPIGTGYSRVAKKELGKKFWSVKGDISSVGEFIRLYLTRYERWASPLFLVGESYGTTRAAGLSGYLIEHGVAFNGIVLVSSVLSFQTLQFTATNDLPYVLFLPSYTAAAWFHKKLPPDLQANLQNTLRQAERFASTTYTDALAKGDRLDPRERQSVLQLLSRFTGLSTQYLDNANLRVDEGHFTKELLRNERKAVGRLDSRFTGTDLNGVGEVPDFDPSMAAIRPPYTAMFNQYVRSQLGYKSDAEYYILGGGFRDWDWGSAGEGFPDTAAALREAFAKNNYMKLFVANGYYDLATPYYATQYTLAHLGLQPEVAKNISTGYYDAGHMMYIQNDSLTRLKQDVSKFLGEALK